MAISLQSLHTKPYRPCVESTSPQSWKKGHQPHFIDKKLRLQDGSYVPKTVLAIMRLSSYTIPYSQRPYNDDKDGDFHFRDVETDA